MTLTRDQKKELIDLLVSIPTTSTLAGRTALLSELGRLAVNRNEANAKLDFQGIVQQLHQLDAMDVLATVIENAIDDVPGTLVASKLEALLSIVKAPSAAPPPTRGFAWLSELRITEIHAAAVTLGLSPDTLRASLHPAVKGALPDEKNKSAQLLSDLQALNPIEALEDESAPLESWLRNAAALTICFREGSVFKDALEAIVQARAGRIAARSAPRQPPSPTRGSVRRLLAEALRSDSDLGALCLDYFPEVHRLFGNGMDRQLKMNMLMERAETGAIVAAVKRHLGGKFAAQEHLVEYEGATGAL